MEKIVKIGEKEVVVKELTYVQALELLDLDKKSQIRKQLLLTTNLTDEEVDRLSFKDGITLQKEINNFNNLDFQIPAELGTK